MHRATSDSPRPTFLADGRVLLTLACLAMAAATSSCTVASGDGWKYSSIGADTTNLDINRAGMKAATISQSPALGKVADTIKGMWTNYLMAEGLKFVSGQYYSHQGKLADQATTVQLEKLRNAKSVADAKAALEAANAARAAEAAAAGLVPASL